LRVHVNARAIAVRVAVRCRLRAAARELGWALVGAFVLMTALCAAPPL